MSTMTDEVLEALTNAGAALLIHYNRTPKNEELDYAALELARAIDMVTGIKYQLWLDDEPQPIH